jgi:Fe-S cluster biogenesis protein NfuA
MSIKDKVEEGLNRIRPALMRDGGNVDLVAVDEENKIVKVRLTGACGTCPMAQMTLKNGVEASLRELIPDLKAVEAI